MRQLLNSCSFLFGLFPPPRCSSLNFIKLERAKRRHIPTHKTPPKYPRWFSGLFLCTGAARFCFGNVFRNPQIYKPSRLDGSDPSIQHPHPELSMAETPMCVHKTESSPPRICSIPKQFPQHLSDSERKGEQCELESTS